MIVRRILIVLSCLVLAACSSSAGRTPSAPPSSAPPVAAGSGPCAYVSAAAVQAFGDSANYPGKVEHELDFGPSCDYGGAVFTLVSPDVSNAAFTYGATKRVSGVGDRAYYGSDFHWLRVAEHKVRFEIRCRLCSQDTELATMTTVAQSVVARIP